MHPPLTTAEIESVLCALRAGKTVGTGGVGYSTDYRFDPDPPPGSWIRSDFDCGNTTETPVPESEVRGLLRDLPLCARELVLGPFWTRHGAAVAAGDTPAALAVLASVPGHDTLKIAEQVASVHRWPEPPAEATLRRLRANAEGGVLLSQLARSLGDPPPPGRRAILERWLAVVEAMLGAAQPREREALQWYR